MEEIENPIAKLKAEEIERQIDELESQLCRDGGAYATPQLEDKSTMSKRLGRIFSCKRLGRIFCRKRNVMPEE